MGIEKNIRHDKFPKQSDYVGQQTTVNFHYDIEHSLKATIVRDDIESPYTTIFRLENGNYLLDSECQYFFNPLMDTGLEK